MKITAELIRVRQDWDPNTNEHRNSVVFAFAGVEVEVPVTAAQVKSIIVESQRQLVPRRVRDSAGELIGTYGAAVQSFGVGAEEPIGELDDALAAELTTDDEQVFGGDFEPDPNEPVRAPTLFQGDDPQSAPSLDAAALAEALDAALAEAQGQVLAPPPTPTQQRQATIAANHAQDPAAQRAAQKIQMRRRAASIPMRQVAKDDMGNPIIEPRGAQIVGPGAHPEVTVRRQTPQITGGDDDAFDQG